MENLKRVPDRLDGRRRVVIEGIKPRVDCGAFPIKRVIGESVRVEADIFTDGHDSISALLRYRHCEDPEWSDVAMDSVGNDRWRASFPVLKMGGYEYSISAWVDHFKTWRHGMKKRADAGEVSHVDLQIGAQLILAAAERARGGERRRVKQWAEALETVTDPIEGAHMALAPELAQLIARYPDTSLVTHTPDPLAVTVERERARFSTWYEFFPRSCTTDASRHGTFRDCKSYLPYVAGMGFDVVYLPPIHPIGFKHRKGPNNVLVPAPGDPGSPWAIGGPEGGHKDLHPDLGSLEDFDALMTEAKTLGLELALDIAFQCSPDHPYAEEHPEWFVRRPDGTIQYAENPPKKYEDIYPFNFETDQWRELWAELLDVFLCWIDRGVRIFRVDNPHTKPFAFWQWLIREVKREHSDVIFLSEAFTRPKVSYHLAKVGFTQSYTYFPWRNNAHEIREYHSHLSRGEVSEYFRPNSWPNTPDILTEYLQTGGRPAFMARLLLAATLTASYGIYGPAFELCENLPREAGSEEYQNSEKYEVKPRLRDKDRTESLSELIALVNRVRRENPALQTDRTLVFHDTDNPNLLCYSKTTSDFSNVILVVVNVDPHHVQSGWLNLALSELGVTDVNRDFQVHDLISGGRYLFHGTRNFVTLDPSKMPGHVFRLRKRIRTERDFEYYL